MKKKYSAVFQ